MLGFEPRISGVSSDRSSNRATTARGQNYLWSIDGDVNTTIFLSLIVFGFQASQNASTVIINVIILQLSDVSKIQPTVLDQKS